HWFDPYRANTSTVASTNCEFRSSPSAGSSPVYPRCAAMVRGLAAPGAKPSDPATGRNPASHSAVSLTRRNTAFTCKAGSLISDTFFSVKLTAGTTLLWPSTTPALTQPVDTASTCTPLVTSRVGPQPADKPAIVNRNVMKAA